MWNFHRLRYNFLFRYWRKFATDFSEFTSDAFNFFSPYKIPPYVQINLPFFNRKGWYATNPPQKQF